MGHTELPHLRLQAHAWARARRQPSPARAATTVRLTRILRDHMPSFKVAHAKPAARPHLAPHAASGAPSTSQRGRKLRCGIPREERFRDHISYHWARDGLLCCSDLTRRGQVKYWWADRASRAPIRCSRRLGDMTGHVAVPRTAGWGRPRGSSTSSRGAPRRNVQQAFVKLRLEEAQKSQAPRDEEAEAQPQVSCGFCADVALARPRRFLPRTEHGGVLGTLRTEGSAV